MFGYGLWLGTAGNALGYCSSDFSAKASGQHFHDHGNGTVTDNKTGLMWKKCLQGLQGQQCNGKAGQFTWDMALKEVNSTSNSGFAGYSDWRLPSVQELSSLVEPQCNNPAINPYVFPHTLPGGVWAGDDSGNSMNAQGLDFVEGKPFKTLRAGGKYVRLVRNAS